MAQYKKGGWGSVSTNFNPVTGFTSEANRMNQRSKERYDNAQDQLRSQKEVLGLQTTQMQSAANMDAKTAQYELKALSNFSTTLNNFLTTTVAEEAAKRKEADIRKHMDEYRRKDAAYWETKRDLSNQLSEAQETQGATAAIELQLKELEEKRELDRTRDLDELSGNEKFAFYAVKAESIVKNAPIGLQNYYQDNGEVEIEQKWKEKVDGKYPTIKVKDVTDPRDRQTVARMYQTKVLNETDMGGLKSKFQVALLHGPLDDKIQAQLDNDVKNFNKDVARERIRSSNQTLSNILNKREGAPTIESWLKNVYPQYRRDLDLLGDPTGVWDKVAQQMEGVLNETTSKAEAQQVYTGILNAIKNVDLITPAAPKGSPLHKLYQSKFSEDRFTKKFKLQMDLLDKKAEGEAIATVTGTIEGEKAKLLQKINNGEITYEEGHAKFMELLDKLSGEEDPYGYKTATILKFRGDLALGRKPEAWLEMARGIGWENNGQISRKDIAGMPNALIEQLQAEDFEIVDHYTGAETPLQIEKVKSDVNEIHTLIQSIEKKAGDNGGKKSPALSAATRDLASDWYNKLTRYYMSEAGGSYNFNDASNLAGTDIKSALRLGAGGNTETKGLSAGAQANFGDTNPFHWKRTSRTGPWGGNKTIENHNVSANHESLYEEDSGATAIKHIDRQRRLNSKKEKPLSKEERSNTWLFPPVNPEDKGTYDFLLPTAKGDLPQVLKFQAERMGFKEYPRRLLNRQLAALKALADKGDTNAQAVYQILFEAWSPTTGGEE